MGKTQLPLAIGISSLRPARICRTRRRRATLSDLTEEPGHASLAMTSSKHCFFDPKKWYSSDKFGPKLVYESVSLFLSVFFFRWIKHVFFPMINCHDLGATFHFSGTKLPQLQVFVVLPAGPWHLGPTLPAEGAATMNSGRRETMDGKERGMQQAMGIEKWV